MFGTRFIALGAAPTFFGRLRSWFRQAFIADFAVAEILAAPMPVVAKEQEVKLVNIPKPFTTSSSRAQALPSQAVVEHKSAPATAATAEATSSSTEAGPWVQMGPLTLSALRRQIRRRRGWQDLRRRHQMHGTREESTGLLAAAA